MNEPKSKSQRKRELESLHKLGLELGQLTAPQLKAISLPEELEHALEQAKNIKSNIAKKRHFQFIGGILRDLDQAEIDLLYQDLDALKQNHRQQADHFHGVEQWRNRLLSDDKEALTDFINQFPGDHQQQLRQLVNKSRKEQLQGKNLGGAKALFRLLKDIIGPS